MNPDLTPDNGQYMIAAYVIAGIIYLGYAMSLLIRAGRELKK